MSFNLLDAVKGHFNSDMISKAASFLGENEGGISKALGGIIPSVLSGLTSKAASSQGAEEVASMAKEAHSGGILSNLGGFLGDGSLLSKGADLLKGLFGSKASGIIDAIAGFAGIKSSSASSLMSMAAPATLGAIGQHAEQNNLGASGISALLANSKGLWSGLVPAGISSMLGISGAAKETITAATGGSDHGHHDAGHDSDEAAGGGVRWLVPLLLLAALAFLAWWLLQNKGCSKTTPGGDHGGGTHADTTKGHIGGGGDTLTATMPKITIDSTGMVSYDLGKEVEFTLPDGVKFMAAENGFESQLLKFIKTGAIDSVNKSANWFNMFDVQFKTGGNEYAGKALAQLKNCGAILKAYPNVKIKLGGYTDNTGPADVNKRISQQRADKVKSDLIKMGAAAAQVTEAVGYGPEFPVCAPNDTKECQARNRRVACKVASK